MATIRRRGSAWEADLRQDGKRIRRSFGTKEDAEAWLRPIRCESAPPSNVGQLLVSYISAAADGQHGRAPIREGTLRSYRECQRNLERHLGRVRAVRLTDEDLARYRTTRAALGASRITSSKELRLLKSTLAWAARTGQLARTADHLQGLRGLTSTHRDRPAQTLPDESTEALLDAAAATGRPDLRALLALARWAGLRRSEALTLRRVDLDLRSGEVRIFAKHLDDGRLWRPKAGQRRTVPIRRRLAVEMERFVTWRRRVRPQGNDGEWLFLSRATRGDANGARLTDVAEAVRNVYKAAGIARPAKPIHALRATFATELLRAGVSPALVCSAGGWSSIQVVEQSYAGDLSQAVASAFKLLDEEPHPS